MKSILLFVIILAMIQVFLSLLSLAMIQDQALVASKHYLVETKEKPGDGLGRVTHFVPFKSFTCAHYHPPPYSNTTSLLFILLKAYCVLLRGPEKIKKCPLTRRSLKTQTIPTLTWTWRGRMTFPDLSFGDVSGKWVKGDRNENLKHYIDSKPYCSFCLSPITLGEWFQKETEVQI